MPRLMLRVVYKPGENFFIGDLQNRISLNFDVEEEKIRSIKDFSIKLDELIDELANYGDKIEKVVFVADKNLRLSYKGREINLKDIKDIRFEEKTF